MLQVKDIRKTYTTGDFTQNALDGVSLNFRECEFAAILGPSGSGKTTLLNIVGGLDQYDTGDLIINGKSTKKYKARDWDTYRNHSIGFVFQSYNLIPHQTVLSNVELALTLSGVSKAERRRRAKEVLRKVGLEDQMHKKPNQMSGGQMQRVAIARALINDPDILLADEPTGALDSETSVMIMDILKEIAKDRLIIMVTHNPELADQYANRIIRLKDGKIVDDTNPYSDEQIRTDLEIKQNKSKEKRTNKGRKKKTSMSFLTAFSLSMNNLMTKKGRTFMTAFAGSIGIIGIALILSVSNGVQNYIDKVEEDTLSSYPVVIQENAVDMTAMMTAMMGDSHEDGAHELDAVYSNDIMVDMILAMSTKIQKNDLYSFKQYLESDEAPLKGYVNDIKYSYNMDLNVYKSDVSAGPKRVNPSELLSNIFEGMGMEGAGANMMMNYHVWSEMLGNQTLLEDQYDVIAGRWPQAYNELVLVVDDNNEISDYVLYSLGLLDDRELIALMQNAFMQQSQQTDTVEQTRFSFEDILKVTYKLILSADYYEKQEGVWMDRSDDPAYIAGLLQDAVELKIVGVLRPTENAVATSIGGAIGYTKELTEFVVGETQKRQIVQEQLADMQHNVLTGEEFSMNNVVNTYDMVALKLGIVDLDHPSSVSIYPKSFDTKDSIVDVIEAYNNRVKADGEEDKVLNYTDMVGTLMSSVTTIVNVISYVLIAFVSISLVVSSIMIGIITYISVLERTKEIGILRSIGASKRDISRVFNAETLLVGLVAGAIGIGVTLLLLIPINLIIRHLSGISGLAALPPVGGLILVLISMFLTFIAGLIPSRFAARRNPVEALRSE
ncbi:MAG: ATP-binding cassette domain-containing protein [Lachnospiraceae bacterium]